MINWYEVEGLSCSSCEQAALVSQSLIPTDLASGIVLGVSCGIRTAKVGEHLLEIEPRNTQKFFIDWWREIQDSETVVQLFSEPQKIMNLRCVAADFQWEWDWCGAPSGLSPRNPASDLVTLTISKGFLLQDGVSAALQRDEFKSSFSNVVPGTDRATLDAFRFGIVGRNLVVGKRHVFATATLNLRTMADLCTRSLLSYIGKGCVVSVQYQESLDNIRRLQMSKTVGTSFPSAIRRYRATRLDPVQFPIYTAQLNATLEPFPAFHFEDAVAIGSRLDKMSGNVSSVQLRFQKLSGLVTDTSWDNQLIVSRNQSKWCTYLQINSYSSCNLLARFTNHNTRSFRRVDFVPFSVP